MANRSVSTLTRFPAAVRGAALAVSPETLNQLTHALGFLLSVAGSFVLLNAAVLQPDWWSVLGCRVYAAALVSLYLASTLSHSFREGPWRDRFRTLDQVCIFLLIAGTFTPFAFAHLRDGWWLLLTAGVWALTALGILFKLFVRGLKNVQVGIYLALGWLPILAAPRMLEVLGVDGTAWVLAGGLSYTAGTWFLQRDQQVPYWHAVWHLFVVAGSACHYVVIRWYLVG